MTDTRLLTPFAPSGHGFSLPDSRGQLIIGPAYWEHRASLKAALFAQEANTLHNLSDSLANGDRVTAHGGGF